MVVSLAVIARTVGIVPYCVHSSTCLAVEDGQVFRTFQHAPVATYIARRVVGALDVAVVGSCRHVVTLTIDRAWRRFTHHLCLTVAIEVVDHKLRIVSTRADIPA